MADAAARRLQAFLDDEYFGPALARLPKRRQARVIQLISENRKIKAAREIILGDRARRERIRQQPARTRARERARPVPDRLLTRIENSPYYRVYDTRVQLYNTLTEETVWRTNWVPANRRLTYGQIQDDIEQWAHREYEYVVVQWSVAGGYRED